MESQIQPISDNPQELFKNLQTLLQSRIIGQENLIQRMLISLLVGGHLLVEGAPGLAKTTAIKALAEHIEASFQRVQFTPDLLPGDLTGSDIYKPQDGSFVFQHGPLFHNLILADEINRAPAKVQSALLEAMGEKQITVGGKTYPLPELFMVMATQNPIEQEGTYQLPEAQCDRFLMYVKIDYPESQDELAILRLNRELAQHPTQDNPSIKQSHIFSARTEINHIHLSEKLEEYMVQLVMATRKPDQVDSDLARWIGFAASPRATIALDACSRAHAWLNGNDFVSPENIHAICKDVLRHRILLSFEAQAEGITTDDIITKLLQLIIVP